MARPKQQSRKRAAEDEGESTGHEPQNKKTKHLFAVNKEPKRDDDGNTYWEISNRRRVQVSEYKGATLISLREYYERDGKTLPGKQGISLTVEQFNALSELLPEMEKVLRAKDLKVTRPQYPDSQSEPTAKSASNYNKEGDADDDDESDTMPAPSAKSKLSKFKLKANHEATSDEDD